MNLLPLSSITLVTLSHTDDGANACDLMAFSSVPAEFSARVNDRAEPAQRVILHSSARSLASRRGCMFAKTARNRPAFAPGAPQFP
jgi:hypothetical protein